MIANNKPQKVEVTNQISTSIDTSSPIPTELPSAYLTTAGGKNLVNTAPLNSNTWCFVKPNSNYFTLQISNVTVVTNGVAVNHHIGSVYYNLSQTQIEYAIETLLTAYHAQNPSATSIVANYAQMGSNNQVEHNYLAYADI